VTAACKIRHTIQNIKYNTIKSVIIAHTVFRSYINFLHKDDKKNTSTEQKEYAVKYLLNGAIKLILFVNQNCRSAWKTVEYFDFSILCASLETLRFVDWSMNKHDAV
jgi:hypothetical protein